MPTSTTVHISDVLTVIRTLQPSSVLDVGAGIGRWGMLFRDSLDILAARLKREDWRTRIVGLEPFKEYHSPVHEWAYDVLRQETVEEYLIGPCGREVFDIIWIGDVLEHFTLNEGELLWPELLKRARMGVLAAVPVGPDWPQGAVFGNELECHLSVWTEARVREFSDCHKFYRACGSRLYAVFARYTGGVKVNFPAGPKL